MASRIVVTADTAATFVELPLPSGDLTTLRATVGPRHRADAGSWAAEAGLRIAGAEEPGLIGDP